MPRSKAAPTGNDLRLPRFSNQRANLQIGEQLRANIYMIQQDKFEDGAREKRLE
jgi:hypothetical protein